MKKFFKYWYYWFKSGIRHWRNGYMSNEICVGVDSDGDVKIDINNSQFHTCDDDCDNTCDCESDVDNWHFHNLNIDRAEFLLGEFTHAVERVKARKAVLAARTNVIDSNKDK